MDEVNKTRAQKTKRWEIPDKFLVDDFATNTTINTSRILKRKYELE